MLSSKQKQTRWEPLPELSSSSPYMSDANYSHYYIGLSDGAVEIEEKFGCLFHHTDLNSTLPKNWDALHSSIRTNNYL